ncbi:MAG: ribosome maturation factor RimM [Oscillospiraceae bacterium]|jgi:16S rRNA processing protein RimM|nr:ribosome maturation factor RimM [Oscillospiraceae bacterium]
MKKYLEILEITKPHGLKGEMRAKYYCDDPDEIEQFAVLYLGGKKEPVKLISCRLIKNMAVIMLDGVNTIERAQKLAGEFLYIDREDVELDEDVWFICDLIGLDVFDADTGELYGKVVEILQNAPADVYCIKADDGRQLLFPSIPEVLIDVNTDEGKILIRPLKGLFE